MSAWTPGPWFVSDDPRPDMGWNRHISTDPAGENRVCFMANGSRERDGEFAANAGLIAAAPELYEALEFIFSHIADKERGLRDLYPAFGLDGRRAIEMAAAALRKARGEP